MGLRDMKAGTYSFHFYDCTANRHAPQVFLKVGAGDHTWDVPPGFRSEVAVHIRRRSD
jgi:hypothetical protein